MGIEQCSPLVRIHVHEKQPVAGGCHLLNDYEHGVRGSHRAVETACQEALGCTAPIGWLA